MKVRITGLVGAVAVAMLTGCASYMPVGNLYTGVTLPVDASSNGGGTKVGKSTAKSYLGMVAIGDASIETAKKNGGISKVTHIDWDAKNFLGLYGEYTTTVHGD